MDREMVARLPVSLHKRPPTLCKCEVSALRRPSGRSGDALCCLPVWQRLLIPVCKSSERRRAEAICDDAHALRRDPAAQTTQQPRYARGLKLEREPGAVGHQRGRDTRNANDEDVEASPLLAKCAQRQVVHIVHRVPHVRHEHQQRSGARGSHEEPIRDHQTAVKVRELRSRAQARHRTCQGGRIRREAGTFGHRLHAPRRTHRSVRDDVEASLRFSRLHSALNPLSTHDALQKAPEVDEVDSFGATGADLPQGRHNHVLRVARWAERHLSQSGGEALWRHLASRVGTEMLKKLAKTQTSCQRAVAQLSQSLQQLIGRQLLRALLVAPPAQPVAAVVEEADLEVAAAVEPPALLGVDAQHKSGALDTEASAVLKALKSVCQLASVAQRHSLHATPRRHRAHQRDVNGPSRQGRLGAVPPQQRDTAIDAPALRAPLVEEERQLPQHVLPRGVEGTVSRKGAVCAMGARAPAGEPAPRTPGYHSTGIWDAELQTGEGAAALAADQQRCEPVAVALLKRGLLHETLALSCCLWRCRI
eukprot:scaffold503_cov375-Pinguiococcus_pyrenoidosus.AAC.15